MSQEKKVSDLLKEMQGRKAHMAIVLDEFEGVEGCVSLEDLVEEIVGEIEDEYDMSESNAEVKKIDDNTYIVEGYTEIDFLNDEYNMNLPEGDYETVAGMIIDKLAKIPTTKSTFVIGDWKILVLQATNKKIIKLKFIKNT